MASLKEVRTRIRSVKSTQQITKAMKMVAASRLRRAQDAILQLRPFTDKLSDILNTVIKATEETGSNPYAEIRDVERVLLVPVTSDRGLCGAFNSNVVKRTLLLIEEEYEQAYHNDQLYILPVGVKGFDYFRKRAYNVIPDFCQVFSELSFDKVREAADFAMEGFLNSEFDKVILIFNEFKNVATQILCTEQFLPLSNTEEENDLKDSADYIFEPSKAEIKKELIPQSLRIQFYKAILESNASEHGARMTAMEVATENAEELLGDLRILYNRTRQAAITKEILDIVGGAEALTAE
jgi:F-type H+-transporting ATPase subunit gamma